MKYCWWGLLFIMVACSPINKKLGQPDDWWGEEILEEAVEMKTGISLDLSPATLE